MEKYIKKIVISNKMKVLGILLFPIIIIYLWRPIAAFDLEEYGESIYIPNTLHAPYGFSISFRATTVSSWYNYVTTVFYTEKPFKKIYISKMTYEWEGGSGIWEEGTKTDTTISWGKSGLSGIYENMFGGSISGTSQINLHEIFKGKKLGDVFDFALKFIYQIDDGAEIVQIINYRVRVYKDTLRLPMLYGR
jgi:hypothetical protein